ncbi:MAG: hypothetical protein N2C14_04990, partial [Planctomycetales bacterium]
LKAAVASGKMTEKDAVAAYLRAVAKQGGKKSSKMKAKMKYGWFYSIMIGRLKSKDIELGEFELDVDHVTSIYGDRSLKDKVIGKTVKVVGVSGPWLDKLLRIKKGETLKVRSGTLEGMTVSLSPKATVLERAAPFDPSVYPIPPRAFRGFQGIVRGEIIAKSDQGFELTLRVDKVEKSLESSKATDPSVVEGRLLDMRGFYAADAFRETFGKLRVGDVVRVGAAHRDPAIDPLDVHEILEKVEQPNPSN